MMNWREKKIEKIVVLCKKTSPYNYKYSNKLQEMLNLDEDMLGILNRIYVIVGKKEPSKPRY